jgi:hypothetical protein
MQGARNPEEYKTLGRSCGKFYRKNDQTFFVQLQRRLRDEGRWQRRKWAFFGSLLAEKKG